MGEAEALRIKFTSRAAHQVDLALGYVATQSPRGATKLRDKLEAALSLLERHPELGAKTNREGVRRLVLTPFPYLIYYRIAGDEVFVMRFRHGAQRPWIGVS